MSADKPKAKKTRRTMDEVYTHISETEMESTQALKVLRNELPWKDWLLTDFLRYWYWLGVFALDIFITLESARRFHVNDVLGRVVLAVVFLAVAAVAFLAYHEIWIEGPFTRSETIRKAPRKLIRRRRFS